MLVPGTDNDIVNQMPTFGGRVHPGCFESVSLSEECVGNGEIVFSTLGQEEDTIGVDISYTLLTDDAVPCFVIPTDSGIEVSKKDDFVFLWDG